MDEHPSNVPDVGGCLLKILVTLLGLGLFTLFFLGVLAGIVIALGLHP